MQNEESTTMPENNPAIQFPVSLRDWFAWMANEDDIQTFREKYGCSRSEARFYHADAMLAEREKEKK